MAFESRDLKGLEALTPPDADPDAVSRAIVRIVSTPPVRGRSAATSIPHAMGPRRSTPSRIAYGGELLRTIGLGDLLKALVHRAEDRNLLHFTGFETDRGASWHNGRSVPRAIRRHGADIERSFWFSSRREGGRVTTTPANNYPRSCADLRSRNRATYSRSKGTRWGRKLMPVGCMTISLSVRNIRKSSRRPHQLSTVTQVSW